MSRGESCNCLNLVSGSLFDRGWMRWTNGCGVPRNLGGSAVSTWLFWQKDRISNSSELLKLGIKKISRQTVRNILKEEGIEPGPDRTSDSWNEFLKRHGETLWGCDLFSVKSVTTKGVRDLYLKVFLCLQTREAIVTESTEHPNSTWVCEPTLKFIEQSRGRDVKPAMIIYDRDGKYTKEFTETLQQSGIKTNPLPIVSPNLNRRCERFIESIKLECLTKFIIIEKQFSIIWSPSLQRTTTRVDHIQRETFYHRLKRFQVKLRNCR